MNSFFIECPECNLYLDNYIDIENSIKLTAPQQKNIDDTIFIINKKEDIITSSKLSFIQLLFCLF